MHVDSSLPSAAWQHEHLWRQHDASMPKYAHAETVMPECAHADNVMPMHAEAGRQTEGAGDCGQGQPGHSVRAWQRAEGDQR
jgi:hypothetical protein